MRKLFVLIIGLFVCAGLISCTPINGQVRVTVPDAPKYSYSRPEVNQNVTDKVCDCESPQGNCEIEFKEQEMMGERLVVNNIVLCNHDRDRFYILTKDKKSFSLPYARYASRVIKKV